MTNILNFVKTIRNFKAECGVLKFAFGFGFSDSEVPGTIILPVLQEPLNFGRFINFFTTKYLPGFKGTRTVKSGINDRNAI